MEEKDPIKLFEEYYSSALKLDVNEPTSMTLATASSDGRVSARIVLLKHYDHQGFCFYTNITSNKGKQLKENPKAALCFYWDELDRQVRIEGKIERVSESEADAYYSSRARNSQIGAWASKQSKIMENEGDLQERIKELEEQFEGGDIPRPPFWSGFRLVPDYIEFWDKEDFRLHRRILFTKENGSWVRDILYP